MADLQAFRVEQPAFTGTLGELAFALRSGTLLPTTIDLYQLVRDYLSYFERVGGRDLAAASEALPLVAQVVELKLRLLLPRPPGFEEEGEEELASEALETVALLEELEEAILFLRDRRLARRLLLPARTPRPDLPRPERPLGIPAQRLAQLAVRLSPGSYFELAVDRLTLAGAMQRLVRLLRRFGRSVFQLLPLGDWAPRTVVFAAMLELVRQGRIEARQEAPFEAIELELKAEEEIRNVA